MKEFLSKRFNLLLFVTIAFLVLGIFLTILLPAFLFNVNMKQDEEYLRILANSYKTIEKVERNDRLYEYKNGESSMLVDVGYITGIDPEIEIHLIHWSEDQFVEELFYTDDFQEKNFVYYIKIVEDDHYVIAFKDTTDTVELVANFRLYSFIFTFVLYIAALFVSSTFISNNLIKKYSFYDPISVLNSRIAFIHDFGKGKFKNKFLSYHNIHNLSNIIDACGIKNTDMVLIMIKNKLLSVFKFEELYQISESEYIVVSMDKTGIHDILKEAINKTDKEDDIIPYEFKIKTVIVDDSILSLVDAKTIINRIKYAFNLIKTQQEEITYVNQVLFDKINEEIYYTSRLQEAIEKKYIDNYYQIKVDPKTGKAIGAEALSRWIENETVISPGKYIHIAEASGMIYNIDIMSYRNTCKLIKTLQEENLLFDGFRVSTNLSPVTLKNIDIQLLKDIMNEYDTDPKYLSVEVTETVSLEFELIKDILEDIDQLGINIEIDDFSAGNSSFTVLPLLKASTVKIDMAILPKNESEISEVLIYDSLINISNKLGLKIISEGVETKEQVDYLKKRDIYAIQGYYFSKPIPQIDFIKLLNSKIKG